MSLDTDAEFIPVHQWRAEEMSPCTESYYNPLVTNCTDQLSAATMTGAIDPADLTPILHAAARAGTALTYAETLNALGFAFSRPKMRALCVALDDVDAAERGAGRPALACLVVRASDGLPGQGWWRRAARLRRHLHRARRRRVPRAAPAGGVRLVGRRRPGAAPGPARRRLRRSIAVAAVTSPQKDLSYTPTIGHRRAMTAAVQPRPIAAPARRGAPIQPAVTDNRRRERAGWLRDI